MTARVLPIKPPTEPAQVLFGLIEGIRRRDPKSLPKINAAVSLMKVTAKTKYNQFAPWSRFRKAIECAINPPQ